MKKGFTSKELVIALASIGIVLITILPIVFNSINKSEKAELINYAKLYLKRLNTKIITSRIEGKDEIYKITLPKKSNETITLTINNDILENPYNYKGIVKVTYISDSVYEYKIALHSDKIMMGTESKPIEEKNISESQIEKYNKNSFKK